MLKKEERRPTIDPDSGASPSGTMRLPVEFEMSDDAFSLLSRLIERESGIHLPTAKSALLTRRLTPRLRALGLPSFHKYYRLVKTDPDERVQMIDCISTNETRFFREPSQFGFLESILIPRWVESAERGERSRQVRVWCAACSTGEEPYSVAMMLLDQLPLVPRWNVEILASDISTRVLERAQRGVWPADRIEDIPSHLLKRFMLRGVGRREGVIKARRRLKDVIRFARINLLEPELRDPAGFDLVLCRNALIYFAQETKVLVINQLLDRLLPDGHLFVGHAESLSTMMGRVRAVEPTIYQLRDPDSVATRDRDGSGLASRRGR